MVQYLKVSEGHVLETYVDDEELNSFKAVKDVCKVLDEKQK